MIVYVLKLRFCEINLKQNLSDMCAGIAAQNIQPGLVTCKFSSVLGPREQDLLVGTKCLCLGLICPQLRVSVGTNSPLSTPVNPCSLHHFLGNLWCILLHQNGTIPLWNVK